MTKETLQQQIEDLLFRQSSDLSKEEYKDLLEDISSQCEDAINALEED